MSRSLLPTELVIKVMIYLDATDIYQLSLVAKDMLKAFSSESLWEIKWKVYSGQDNYIGMTCLESYKWHVTIKDIFKRDWRTDFCNKDPFDEVFGHRTYTPQVADELETYLIPFLRIWGHDAIIDQNTMIQTINKAMLPGHIAFRMQLFCNRCFKHLSK